MSPLSGFKHRIIALALTFLSGGSLLLAQEQSATAISQQVKEIFQRAAKAVVKIHGVDEHSEICGTGFFIDPTGTLYTAYTVGGEAGNFTIEFQGKKYPARQLLADIRSGTAMLKVDEATPALPIGKSEELEVATPVVAVGYPLDLRASEWSQDSIRNVSAVIFPRPICASISRHNVEKQGHRC